MFRIFCLIIKNNYQNSVYLENTFLVNATPCISLVQQTRFFCPYSILNSRETADFLYRKKGGLLFVLEKKTINGHLLESLIFFLYSFSAGSYSKFDLTNEGCF